MSDVSHAAGGMAVFVLGMHRSGTPALTRVLNLLGFGLPGNLLPANFGNRRGYWEPRDMMQLNERILDQLDRVWFDPKPIHVDDLPNGLRATFVGEAAAFLAQSASGGQSVVPKDPRVSRLLPIWLEASRMAGLDARAIFSCRHPLEVAASLETRDGMEIAHGLELWKSYMLEAEVYSRQLARYAVRYGALLEDWQAELRPALSAIDADYAGSEKVDGQVGDFLSAGGRHHVLHPSVSCIHNSAGTNRSRMSTNSISFEPFGMPTGLAARMGRVPRPTHFVSKKDMPDKSIHAWIAMMCKAPTCGSGAAWKLFHEARGCTIRLVSCK